MARGYLSRVKKRWAFLTTLVSVLRSIRALWLGVGAERCNLKKYRLVSLFLDIFENSKDNANFKASTITNLKCIIIQKSKEYMHTSKYS